MEDRKLNEKESLELIARMIENTKKNVDRNKANPSLAWGYTTIVVSLLVYGGLYWLKNTDVFFLWFLIPVLGLLAQFLLDKKSEPKLVKTFLDRVIQQIWMVIGLICVGMSIFSFTLPIAFPILFFISLLCLIAHTLTGCICDIKSYIYLGVVGILLSYLCLVVKGPEQILVFAGVFLIGMVIPGHILNYNMKKERN